ncbi:MAG: hypothetical protein QOE06_2580 [Thermoleophilaceae bacterium]|jgi:hypothetical protein|nr:hypothetical protein [Thermoleophilaceae bacterium]
MTGFAGVALLAVMFVDWFHAGGSGHSAWEAFSVLDVVLAVVATMAIAIPLMAAVHITPAVSLAIASLLLPIASVVTIVLTVRALAPPDLGAGDTGRSGGLWLGLGAVALVTLGAFATMRDERFPEAARIEVPVETLPPPEGGTA